MTLSVFLITLFINYPNEPFLLTYISHFKIFLDYAGY